MAKSFLADGAFWIATVERAVSTTAQGALAVLGAGALGVLDVDWVAVASVAALAGVASVLKSVATAGLTDGTPSIGSVEELH